MGNRESGLQKLEFTAIEGYPIPEHSLMIRVEDGTIFIIVYQRQREWRISATKNGREFEFCVCEGIKNLIAEGNALYFERGEKGFYKAAFSPPDKVEMTFVRCGTKNDEVCRRGIFIMKKNEDDVIRHAYRIGDDPEADAIILDDEKGILRIHRKKAVWIRGIPGLAYPSISESENSNIILEVPGFLEEFDDLSVTYAQDFSPHIYIASSEKLFIFDTELMEFYPPLELCLRDVFQIVGVYDGVITLKGCPIGYYLCSFWMSAKIPELKRRSIFKSEFLLKFKPLKILGQGGFGCVFHATHIVDQCEYAVKRISIHGSDEARNDALKEVRALSSLNNEGIVRYNSSWIEKPPTGWQIKADAELQRRVGHTGWLKKDDDSVFIYIQMELCKESLHDWLRANVARDLSQAKNWFKQIVSAVGFLHAKNKIHRDLKPGNILFGSDGRLKLCDLGLVAVQELNNGAEIDKTRTIIGTPMYMAPEQNCGIYTSKVDIFSLGLILVDLCVYMPSRSAYEVFSNYQQDKPTTVLQHLPEVDQFVSWLTNQDAEARPNCEAILAHDFLE